jgi:NTP pyrophosphatase (non-canonical NTP hydrolase)
MSEYEEEQFVEFFNFLQKDTYRAAKEHGWFEEGKFNIGEKLALIHSEVSEVLEAFRYNNPPSEKIADTSSAEEELADVVIRVMDFASHLNFDVARAIVLKHRYNQKREYKHGGKLF